MKFQQLTYDYLKIIEENKQLKKTESEFKKEIQVLIKGRDSFKEQFLELREINKDLKQRFISIEKQVTDHV